jgi:crotonobetainyl-CoA:carnitine CoA-transferase CaiB-like acyl-CoA transferase
VLEIADELGEYCGKVLAGLGADVVKVEPPGGEVTRGYGPFYHDEPHPDRSLYFWHYNFGKRSMVLDLDDAAGQERFRALAANADVVIETRPRGWADARAIGYERLSADNPALVYARITPFGDDGPWADYHGSDLIHLALGGVMMNCGYDPDPTGTYETPPMAPQMWHAYHVVGEMTAISAITALIYRLRSGLGQLVSGNVHEAVAKNTETDLPDWIFLRQPHYRKTCRHSTISPTSSEPAPIARTKDGRWVMPWLQSGMVGFPDGFAMVPVLSRYGMEADLSDPKYHDAAHRIGPKASLHFASVIERFVGSLMYDRDVWREAQAQGLPWAPVRRPEENVDDEHWRSRGTFVEVHHPELDETFTYVTSKWMAPGIPWRTGPRPPLLGEHTSEVQGDWSTHTPNARYASSPPPQADSVRGEPFALAGVRVLDLSWQLASAGAGRFLAAFGAEVIKVEHESRWDGMRFASIARAPEGGRATRDAATGPLPVPSADGPNRCGSFMEINAGKLGLSLDLKSAEGKAVLTELIRTSDIVVEGFSPGTMDRMGFGFEQLRKINPSIIYAQQSGLGQHGTYGKARTFGPTAQAMTGLSDMSGLPDPFQPAGIGYSYLDWFGAYNLATAMIAALHRREVTGEGCWIDSSQAETGLYLTGTAILDYSANHRPWARYGNRSPYKLAAPHGAFPTRGSDRWIAIACFTQQHWEVLAEILRGPGWLTDRRFASLDRRLEHQDELESLVGTATAAWDEYELMAALQARGVPAGVCQTAQDRYERDPQLDHLDWLIELDQDEIGTWPVKEFPVRLSHTPAYMGGPYDRSGPSYGQDNEAILRRVQGNGASVTD